MSRALPPPPPVLLLTSHRARDTPQRHGRTPAVSHEVPCITVHTAWMAGGISALISFRISLVLARHGESVRRCWFWISCCPPGFDPDCHIPGRGDTGGMCAYGDYTLSWPEITEHNRMISKYFRVYFNIPSKYGTSTQYLVNVGPASWTLNQHRYITSWMSCVGVEHFTRSIFLDFTTRWCQNALVPLEMHRTSSRGSFIFLNINIFSFIWSWKLREQFQLQMNEKYSISRHEMLSTMTAVACGYRKYLSISKETRGGH